MNRTQVRLQQLISAVLFVGVLAMLAWLSNRYAIEADLHSSLHDALPIL